MSKSIFKGFKAHDGTKEFNTLTLEDGYIHLIRTDSNKENGYIYFNGKKYGNGVSDLVVSTTYSYLKALRDSNGLSVGTWYRITDYNTTVYNDENARAAGHPFDILVLATDVNQLSEDAKAVHSARDIDGYFEHVNLSAWKLKYSLDNDTTKFAWAGEGEGSEKWTTTIPDIGVIELTQVSTNDTTYEGYPYKFTTTYEGMSITCYVAHLELQDGEDFIPNVIVVDGMGEPIINQFPITTIVHDTGKGVIWEMQDEFNNLCSYDFKNIQFKRSRITSTLESPSEEECAFYGKYVGQASKGLPSLPEGYAIDPNDSKYFYTFSIMTDDGTVKDTSIGMDYNGNIFVSAFNRMHENGDFLSFMFGVKKALELNNNVFVNIAIENTFGLFCKNNTFMNLCSSNSFGDNCYGNTFMNFCSYNSFGDNCQGNSFGDNCQGNSFGNDCSYNSFGDDCYDNTFGNDCIKNSFGECSYNSFGDDCRNNSFGDECRNNSFGNDCRNNSFGNDCYDNTFGNECTNNSFGNHCQYNSFGNGCVGNSFGNGCVGNTFGNKFYYNEVLDYVEYITVFEWVRYVSIGNTNGATVRYAQILNGTHGTTSSNKLKIDFAGGTNYTQVAGLNSDGGLKIWVPADMVATTTSVIDAGEY